MADSEDRIGPKKESAIVALLTARTIEEAAKTANVPVRTLYRWLKEPEFDRAYRRAKRAAFGQATSRLQQGAAAAASTMLKIMIDAGVPAPMRLKAADCVFGHAKNAIEIEEIEARLRLLEEAADVAENSR